MFKLVSSYKPTGDQPRAIKNLVSGIKKGVKHQVLLGVTGSGKTFTLSNVIARLNLPTIVISHNKVLAAQLYQEFKEFFPENAVHYFVSYYDYYQPEAYIPSTDTYIEKDAKINELIDQLRHAATADVLTRKDVIIVASVSCIYGIGDPETYENISLNLYVGQRIKKEKIIENLVDLQYRRNDIDPQRGEFRKISDLLEIWSPNGSEKIQILFNGDIISSIKISPANYKIKKNINFPKKLQIFPAKHFVNPRNKLELAISNIEAELAERLEELKKQGKLIEAQRLQERTNFDLEMLRETGYCHGIENYSRHLSFRKEGEPPFTLIDYFIYSYGKDGFLTIIDESHVTIPQIKGMYEGDRSRKEVLVEYGFRLPSALDNRPLKFKEFEEKISYVIYSSATPGEYELKKAKKSSVVEQLIRPTGILDPEVEVRPTKNQLKDLEKEILERRRKKERTLVLTLTKRLAEELADYLLEKGIRIHWIHSEIKTLDRPEILKDLREGKVDVLVGINLLREGLDLPEVSLVAILDADKEGFLRSERTLIQIMGRAARHISGKVILYADKITGSMKRAIEEVKRRRKIQEKWNIKHKITPKPIIKPIRPAIVGEVKFIEDTLEKFDSSKPKSKLVQELEKEMWHAAKEWDFEKAAKIRDRIRKITQQKDF